MLGIEKMMTILVKITVKIEEMLKMRIKRKKKKMEGMD